MTPLAVGRSALAVAVALVLLLPVGANAQAGPARYVDCGATSAGDGTQARPWNSLTLASSFQLSPGARLLLRRGSVCTGLLAPEGSGSRRSPALIGAYGRGPKPRIEGNGEDAVLLRDTSHVVLERLEVSNPGDGSGPKRGVTAVAELGPVSDLTLRHLYIHDVGGDLTKGAHGSAGIEAAVWGDPAPAPQRFQGLLIAGNRIEDVSRSGIRVDGTVDRSRPTADQPWPQASSGVVIRSNHLAHLAGDGIVPTGTLGARVIGNVVLDGNLAGGSYTEASGLVCNAGIWTFHSNRTRIVRNEVGGMHFNGCDGTGYDVDYDQDGTVVQFNYSHDNEGGFILLCGEEETRRADVRFNLSIDDDATLNTVPCRIAEGVVGTLSGVRFFNNTIVAAKPRLVGEGIELPALALGGDFSFENNIVYATERGSRPFPCGEHCSHNLFFNLPAAGEQSVVADPAFRDPRLRGRGRLRVGRGFRLLARSPAIGAGARIPAGARRDFFGNRISQTRPPDIGFFQVR